MKSKKPFKPKVIKRTLAHRLKQVEERQDLLHKRWNDTWNRLIAHEQAYCTNASFVAGRLSELERNQSAHIDTVGKRLHTLESDVKYACNMVNAAVGRINQLENKLGKRPIANDQGFRLEEGCEKPQKVDFYPTKRDLWALRARVMEINTALTQMMDRWEAVHQ